MPLFLGLGLLASVVFVGSVLVLQFTISRIPLDYAVPKPAKEEKVNPQELGREFASLFPKPKRERTEKVQPRPAAVPKVEVLGVARGKVPAVMFRAGKRTYYLLKGEQKDGWKLVEVEENRVVLSYKGTEVVVPLKEKRLSFRPVRRRPGFPATDRKGEPKTAGQGSLTVSRELVDRLTKNYGELLRQVDIRPYYEGGRAVGFKIYWLSPQSVFYKLGFRPGDVIVSVNGVPLKTTEDLFRVIQIIRNEPSLRVVVLRNGNEQTFNVRIE